MAQKKRIEYIDCIKGFCILWVVTIHLGENLPDWIMVPYRMPLFFFMSGIFFSYKPFKPFLIRKINTLIIPLLFFLFIPFCIHFLREIILPNITPIFSKVSPPYTYKLIGQITTLTNVYNEYVNEPFRLNSVLWFLLALFNIQIIFYGLKTFFKQTYTLAILSVLLTIIGEICIQNNINGLFFIPVSLRFFMYYTFGSLFGKRLIDFITSRQNAKKIIFICLPILIVITFLDFSTSSYYIQKLDSTIRTFLFIPVAFVFFKEFYHLRIFKPIIFFGKNSLIILGIHRILFWLFMFIVFKFRPDIQNSAIQTSYPFYACMFIFTCSIGYFAILFFNKYFPYFVAKKDLIKLMPKRNAIPEIVK